MSNRGGKREGAGRKTRSTPKSLPIWCGQITNEQRDFILRWLSPDERFGALAAKANNTCTLAGGTPLPEKPLPAPKQLPRPRKLSRPATRK